MKLYTNLTFALTAAALMPSLQANADTWKSLGNCEFRENAAHAWWDYSYYPEISVEIQESEQTPGRYRLVNPYREYPAEIIYSFGCIDDNDYYIIINASDPNRVYMEKTLTGFVIGGDAETETNLVMWVCSQAYDYLDRYGNLDRAAEEGLVGQLKDGYINFPSGSLLATYVDETLLSEIDPDFSGQYAWWILRDDKFRIHMPGAKYLQDNSVQFLGVDDELTSLTYEVLLDNDVQNARLAFIPGEFDASNFDKIIDGSIEYTLINESTNVTFPYPGDGVVTVYAVPYYDGKPTFTTSCTNELDYSQDEWVKLSNGVVMYTDAIMSSNEMNSWGFVYDEQTYPVNLEEHATKKGYYRIKNPYGEGYPYYDENKYDASHNWYMYIDATDRDHVIIERMPEVGCDMGAGSMEIWCRAQRYLEEGMNTKEEIEAMDLYGHFDGEKITFPKDALLIRFRNNPSPTAWYWANNNGHFVLDLKDLDGVEDIAADVDPNAPAEYYNLSGIKVNSSRLTPGIYIVRKGNKTYKEVVK